MRRTTPARAKRYEARTPKVAAGVGSHQQVLAAARQGVRAALKSHKKAGHHIVVWQDGKVVRLPPGKISV